MPLYTYNSRPWRKIKPNRVESQSTYGPNVVLTRLEVLEVGPPTDTKELSYKYFTLGSTQQGSDRHWHIKVSISIRRMYITLWPSWLSLEYFLDVTNLGIKLHWRRTQYGPKMFNLAY